MKMKNRSRIYDITLGTRKNRLRFRHGHEYSKYKKFLGMMMLICIKQHLSNIWSSIYEKVKEDWGCVEKMLCFKKKIHVWFILEAKFGDDPLQWEQEQT